MTPSDPETYLGRLLDPRARGYLLAAGGALAVLFVALSQRGAALVALVPVTFAAGGLLLRWSAAPALVVAATGYLLVFPVGLPLTGYSFAEVRRSYFQATDLMLVAAVLVYVSAHGRLLGLAHRATPAGGPGDAPRRPLGGVTDDEFPTMFLAAAAAVAAGQLLWLALTKFDFAPDRFPPVRAAEGGVSKHHGRFVLFAAVFAFGGLAAGMALWFRRMAALSRDEARAVLTDTLWRENRRELARVETWRAYGRPGASGARVPFFAGLRVPFVVFMAVAAVGFVVYELWVIFTDW